MIAEQFYYNDVQGPDQQFLFETNLFTPINFDMSPIGNVLNQNAAPQGKINVSAVILDEFGNPMPWANIAINNIATAISGNSGSFTIKNINPFDNVTITNLGYQDISFTANSLPNKIAMTTGAIALQGVTIKPKPKPAPIPEKETNWYLWGGAGLLAILAYKKFSGSSKVIKAKI